MDYYAKKEENKKLAKEHTEEMEKAYPQRIEHCVINSKIYGIDGEQTTYVSSDRLKEPKIIFANMDSVSALFKYATGKTAILNFASYKSPGGMFIEGSFAQEEALCHASFLYNVLRKMPGYYKWNNEHKNRALYLNRAIYTPEVVFTKDGKSLLSDVITCAAPNFGAASKWAKVSARENENVLKDRISFIRNVVEEEDVSTLIAGAYGCGVFKQSPETVAKLFKEVFAKTAIDKIIYAVPGKDKNASVFRKYFTVKPK